MVRTPFIDKNGIKRGAWSGDEDNNLRAFVERFGHPNWRQLPKYAGLMRCGKSCRLRWMNYLRPGLKRGNYSLEEEQVIIKLHKELGNRLGNTNSSTSTEQLTESSHVNNAAVDMSSIATLTSPEVSSSDHLYSIFNGITEWIEEESIEQLSIYTSLELDSFSWTNPIDYFQTESFDHF
ncbi:unnamed protein product [Withania somnifera]